MMAQKSMSVDDARGQSWNTNFSRSRERMATRGTVDTTLACRRDNISLTGAVQYSRGSKLTMECTSRPFDSKEYD